MDSAIGFYHQKTNLIRCIFRKMLLAVFPATSIGVPQRSIFTVSGFSPSMMESNHPEVRPMYFLYVLSGLFRALTLPPHSNPHSVAGCWIKLVRLWKKGGEVVRLFFLAGDRKSVV